MEPSTMGDHKRRSTGVSDNTATGHVLPVVRWGAELVRALLSNAHIRPILTYASRFQPRFKVLTGRVCRCAGAAYAEASVKHCKEEWRD